MEDKLIIWLNGNTYILINPRVKESHKYWPTFVVDHSNRELPSPPSQVKRIKDDQTVRRSKDKQTDGNEE